MTKYPILPYPKQLDSRDGEFSLKGCDICVSDGLDPRVIKAAERLRTAVSQKTGGTHKLCRGAAGGAIYIKKDTSLSEEGYVLEISPDGVIIAGDDAGCFYGIGTLLQLLEICGSVLPALCISDSPDMKYRGFYHDATRGRVPSVEGIKKMVDRLARYKINSLQLYVEHSFDFDEFKSDMRTCDDYLTAEDILEIDAYCYDNFIDFVPSLSTFGHLFELLCKKEYAHLCELENFVPPRHFWAERMAHHTIDPSNPESFETVCSLIDQYLPLFRSKYFNICCDETFDLCRGRNAGKDKAELYIGFVTKIIDHVRSAGKTAMMWGDIALEHPELLPRIPKDTVFLNWEYAANPDVSKAEKVKNTGLTQILCPGTTSWTSLIEHIDVSVPNILKMARAGFDNGALGLLNTNWGDYGHPCHPECALYGMLLGACTSWNIATAADSEFESAASLSLYGTDTNIIPLIDTLGRAHYTASWIQFFNWRWTGSAEFNDSPEIIAEAAQRCREVKNELSALPDKKGVLKFLCVTAEGIALLCDAAVAIKRENAVSADWKRKANVWFTDYAECWLAGSKPSELGEIKSFINNF